ncbi:uncharacterized protein LOC132961604 isoform X2 [Labrus mixtus]|uniref:uncharacterized protein LOC132961604 isoform X2 n=1 Tax=Labrus mixtus TaxID=508554 RepID=UPI0029C0DBA0|nr:uncharacterized protein LOC132961604 isoform X2 [Labrus mixtus]
MEGLFHLYANELHLGNTIYILNYFTAGIILFGKRDQRSRHSLSRFIFPEISSVFLVDLMANKLEEAESAHDAKRLRDYLKMRAICYGRDDWGAVRWKGSTMHHPFQRDSSSCGVIVTKMAKALMEAFPALPVMSFGTSKKEMAFERTKLALSLLSGSVFDMDDHCAMCSTSKPPGSGPPTTDWKQCDTCERWYHEQCLAMDEEKLQNARLNDWDCALCI